MTVADDNPFSFAARAVTVPSGVPLFKIGEKLKDRRQFFKEARFQLPLHML